VLENATDYSSFIVIDQKYEKIDAKNKLLRYFDSGGKQSRASLILKNNKKTIQEIVAVQNSKQANQTLSLLKP